MQRYTFKRYIYDDIVSCFGRQSVIFLLGPRKCGKTVCLHQLCDSYDNSEYIDFKNLNDEESIDAFKRIRTSIENNEDKKYFLDEITYAFYPDKEIERIAITLDENSGRNTKIVFAGSQSRALEYWGHRSFASSAGFIRADFINYSEWMRYKGIKEASEESYMDFLYHVSDFYGFSSIEEYIKGCLDETIISNLKATEVIFGNDVSLLSSDNIDELLDICYTTLFILHNQVGVQTFQMDKNKNLEGSILHYFQDVCRQWGDGVLQNKISGSFIGHYTRFNTYDLDTLKQAFQFLYRCGIISITPVSDSFDNIPNVVRDLQLTDSRINYKSDLFLKYNFCFRHPMFYISILQDILGEDMPSQEDFPRELLGSIVECQIRGLLDDNGGCFEYHDIDDTEIDYVNMTGLYAVEISVSNKRLRALHFDKLPEDFYDLYLKISVSRDRKELSEGIIFVPYYEFVKGLSDKDKEKEQYIESLRHAEGSTTTPHRRKSR